MPELMALAAQQFARPLDRARPLWEITFVEGLQAIAGIPPGAVALIAKVHHAAVDGFSGEEIMAALLDTSPVPRQVTAGLNWRPDGIPSPPQLLLQGIKTTLRSPPRSYALLRTAGLSLMRAAKERIINNGKQPPAIFSAPHTITNGSVTTRRVFGGAQLPLERINRIRHRIPGTTMNDVVLALCAGALRRYLQDREILPDESLVAMAPISVRKRHEQNAGGNRIFAMLVSLATHEPDPLLRLERVRASVRTSMQYKKAGKAAGLAENLPAAASGLATRWYIRNEISQKHRPWFNVVITNIPGPGRPLYMAGAKLIAQWGSGPIIDGVGLIIVITSYNGFIGLGLTSCQEIFPDIELLATHLHTALDELEAAAEPKKISHPDAAQHDSISVHS
jgi:diacylglycerol O-acyltransferase